MDSLSDAQFWQGEADKLRKRFAARGANAGQAFEWAAEQVEQRKKMALLVGRDAAAAAEMTVFLRADGTYGQYLQVPEKSIPAELRSRAEAWANEPNSTKN